MKFGKQLEVQSIPKYRGHYIQYKELKRALKVYTGVEKDQSTVQEVTHWASSFLRLGPNPEVSPEMRLNVLLRHEMERIGKFAELEEGGIRKELAKLEADVKQDVDKRVLAKRLDELSEQIVQLKSYARLNFSGFRKVLKKYDKWSTSKTAVSPWFMAEVVRAPFMKVGFTSLLAQLNRIAKVLRKAGVFDGQPQGSSGYFDASKHARREIVFLVDPKDTMQVHVHLAKYLNMKGLLDTAPDRRRTSNLYLDTPTLDVYSSHVVESGSPLPTTHFRHAGGDAVMLVREVAGDPPTRTEVLLATPEAVKLVRGEGATPATSGSSAPADAAQVAGGVPQARREQAASVLTAVQDGVAQGGQRPMAMASYVRTSFVGDDGGFTVILDEDVRMARVTEPFAVTSGLSEYLPYNVLTICWSAERSEDPSWFRHINDSANLMPSPGFTKAAHTLAYLFAKDLKLSWPSWYRTVMNIATEEGGSHDAASQETVGDSARQDALESAELNAAAEQAAKVAQANVASRTDLSRSASARLLHEFGTTPQEEAALAAARHADAESAPAGDTGALDEPLLARPGGAAASRGAAAPRGGGFLRRLTRALGLARPEFETEALPVRNAIVAVQPKTLFSNERTFLEWMHFATIFASMGVVLMHSGSKERDMQLGRFIVLASIFLVGWSLRTFNWRADALDSKEIRDYYDPVGPTVVVLALLGALYFGTVNAVRESGGLLALTTVSS